MTKKQVLVVGAGSGIGKSLLATLKENSDCDMYGISRRGIQLSDQMIPGSNYKCDLTDEGNIISFFNFYKKQIRTLDAIYLCQGDGLFGEISSLTKDSIEKHFSLNVTSSFLILQKFYPLLKSSTSNPFVCFLSSTAGKIGFPESTAYCASKHAVAGLAKSIREEWKKDKIRIFTVYPGAISTEIWNGREGFDTKDMISPEEFALYLKSLLELPASINLEESYVLPMKGIL
jgi:NAD(P)-dependent dehydrogenase (short-subunit alcohol dehydrogenase family)